MGEQDELTERFKDMSHAEIRAELKKKGRLTTLEAALFLGKSRRRLYNMMTKSTRDPSLAPRRSKVGGAVNGGVGGRVYFQVADIEAWERSQTEIIGSR